MTYGKVPLAPLIFMDDIIHGAGEIEAARLANVKVDSLVKTLKLSLNKDKTSCILMGSSKQKQDTKKQLKINLLVCGDFETKVKEKFKWLGQILSEGGQFESVSATVEYREGKIRGACFRDRTYNQ